MFKIDGRKIVIRHTTVRLIQLGVKLRQDGQAGRGFRVGNAVHNGFSADEWFPAPIQRDFGKEAMFNAVLFTGARWIVTDIDGAGGFIDEAL